RQEVSVEPRNGSDGYSPNVSSARAWQDREPMSIGQQTANPFLAAAIDVVLRAGEIQLSRLGTRFRIDLKGQNDIVTEVDLEVERMCRATMAQRFPDHGVLGEETAETGPVGGGSHRWLFDPIDGTVNYAHGLPFFCASLAFEVNGEIT